MDEYARALGDRIRELRRGAGLTQTDLGAPMTRSFISAIEHGRALPSLAALLVIAARLGVSPATVLEPVKYRWSPGYTRRHGPRRGTTPGEGR